MLGIAPLSTLPLSTLPQSDQGGISYFPDEGDGAFEQDDYAPFDFVSSAPLPPDVVVAAPLIGIEFPDSVDDDEPDGEYYWAQGPPPEDLDQIAATCCLFPDQGDEPEDEDFGFADAPRPPDFTLPQPLTLQYFPDEAEEPEDEDFGFSRSAQPEDSDQVATLSCLFPDQADADEDPDSSVSDAPLPPDAVGAQPLAAPLLSDDLAEDQDEDYGTAWVDPIPPDVTPVVATHVVPNSWAMGGIGVMTRTCQPSSFVDNMHAGIITYGCNDVVVVGSAFDNVRFYFADLIEGSLFTLAQLYFGTSGSASGATTNQAAFLAAHPGLTLQDFSGIAPPGGTAPVPASFPGGFTQAASDGNVSQVIEDSAAAGQPFCLWLMGGTNDYVQLTFSPSVNSVGFNWDQDLIVEFRRGTTVLYTQTTVGGGNISAQFLGYSSGA